MAEKVRYPDITVKLIGEDGNSFSILGRVRKAMKRHKVPSEMIKAFSEEATSGNYDHLLYVVTKWVNVE